MTSMRDEEFEYATPPGRSQHRARGYVHPPQKKVSTYIFFYFFLFFFFYIFIFLNIYIYIIILRKQ